VFIPLAKRGSSAFSATDLFIIMGLVFALGAIGAALFFQKKRAQASQTCGTNLKMVTMGLKMWSPDSAQSFPWRHHRAGSSAHTNSGMVSPHFRALSNEIGNAKLLTCPTDSRRSTTSWTSLNDSNISYFINFEGEETRPSQIAFGDRLFSSTIAPTNNLLILTTNATYQWEKRIHNRLGTVSFSDGSVRMLSDQDLQRVFHDQENVGSRIQLPR